VTAQAGILADALLAFPVRTEYVEYDNLALLRNLPNYNVLRQEFSGKPLEEARIVLGQLGIRENQVDEIVTGSDAKVFYGIISGTFSGQLAAKTGKSRGYAVKLPESQAFCTGRETCVVFLEDSLAAFGSVVSLKEMLETRQGAKVRLSSNRNIAALINGTDANAPVRGVLWGTQLKSSISQLLQDWTGWKRDWSSLSANISGIGYGVRFDSKAHVSATLDCTSRTAAAVLIQMLDAVGAVQSTAVVPFQNLQVSSSGSSVSLKADTAMPGAAVAATPTAPRRP